MTTTAALRSLGDVIADAECRIAEGLALLTGDYDVESAGAEDMVRAEVAAYYLNHVVLRQLARTQSPVRQGPPQDANTPGGPVLPPTDVGERRASGYGTAFCGAVTGSAGSVVDPSAGANVPGESLSPGCGNGRVGGAPDAATFSLPEWVGPPEFQSGAALLRGASC